MSVAFEITEEDVDVAMAKSEPTVKKFRDMLKLSPSDILSRLNLAKVERAALAGDDMDEQTNYAHEEIREQVKSWWVKANLPKRRVRQ